MVKSNLVIDPKFFRPAQVEILRGNPARARNKMGREAKTNLETVITMMVKADMRFVENG